MGFIGIRAVRVGLAVLALAAGAYVVEGCRREPAQAASVPATPTVRLYVVSTVAGALDPCGCTKDQLGGIDHAAALVASEAKHAPHSLVLGAGALLFPEPLLEDAKRTQDLWKAEAIASSFAEMGLVAWAPGANDFAAGAAETTRLAQLSRAEILAGNLHAAGMITASTRVVDVNGYKVGIAGVSVPKGPLGGPAGVDVGDPRPALTEALATLKKQGAQIAVALIAAERGAAMRLAEQVPGFAVAVVGKPYEQGDGSDAPFPAAQVGGTLVVQGPNHLQGVVIVDLFVRGSFDFKDGSGLAAVEQRESLEGRVRELETRVKDAEGHGAGAADLAARRADLSRLKKELASVVTPEPPAEGSFFRYRAEEVRQGLGSQASVSARMADYYRRVNDYNKDAFKDRVPKAAQPGDATYIGAEECATCHDEAYEFWKHTPHASAYETLSKQHKEFNLDCVGCHVTGYEKPGGSTVTHVDHFQDVQCEVCHGPGSKHEKNPADVGLLVRSPPKTLCAPACHHPPHVAATWSVEDAWKVILGKGHGKK